MGSTTTRARAKTKVLAPLAPDASDDTKTEAKAPSTSISQVLEDIILEEQRKQRDAIALLSSQAAAAEERANHTAASMRDMEATMKELEQDVLTLEDKLRDTRSRLTDIERENRKMEDSLRSKSRNSIEEIRQHVQALKDQRSLDAANVGRIVGMRAESMVSDLDDARSDISSQVSAVTESSVAPCYAHATSHDARRAAEHRHRAFPAGR